MYIEVFLLDNLLMNAVICVLAGAVCGRSVRLGRVLLFSLGGAVYGAAAMYMPVLSMFPCKTILCLAMAMVFPYEGLRGYITGLTAILAAALTIGGLGFLMICAFGNVRSLGDGISLRLMLLIAFAASIMPGIARRVRGKRLDNQNRHTLLLKRGDKEYELDAMVDSGNLVREPLSGLPVILVSHDIKRGVCPIPYCTQGGDGVLWAARTEVIYIDGVEAPPAFVAKAPRSVKNADAIVPLSIIPEKEKDHEKTGLVCAKALAEAFFETCRTKQFGLHAFGRNTAPAAQPRRGSPSCRGDAAGRGGTGKADSSQS